MHAFPTSSPPAEQVFRPSLAKKILGTIGTVAVLAVLALVFVPKALPNTFTHAVRFTIVGVLIAIIAAIAVFIMLNGLRRVVVTDTAVEIRNPFRVVHAFPRTTTRFSTHVLKRTTNGIPSGTTRSLVASTGGTETSIALGSMSRSTFNEMFALINSSQIAQRAGAQQHAQGFAKPDPISGATRPAAAPAARTFTSNPASAQPQRTTGAAIGGIGVVAAVFGLWARFAGGGMIDSTIALACIMIGVGIAIAGVLMLVRAAAQAHRTPRSVEVTSQALVIDGQLYPYAGMSRIWVSPTSYAKRRLRLVSSTGSGTVKTFDFGGSAGKPEKQLFPEWDLFVGLLERATAGYPGLIAYDLE